MTVCLKLKESIFSFSVFFQQGTSYPRERRRANDSKIQLFSPAKPC